MIQGFIFQVNNFSNSQNKVNLKNNTNSQNKFNEILDNKTKTKSANSNEKNEVKANNQNNFNQNQSVNSRRVEVKNNYSEENKQSKSEDSKEVVSKDEKAVKELIENLNELLAVFQNVIGINLNELEDVDLESLNLEISIEELENLKLSLESLIDKIDLGEFKEQIENTMSNLDQMIKEVSVKGEIEVDAKDFILELKETIDLVNSKVNQNADKTLIQEVKDTSSELQALIDAIDKTKTNSESKNIKSNLEDASKGKDKIELDINLVDEEIISNSDKNTDESILKIKIVSEKKEGINLFNSFSNNKNLDDIKEIELNRAEEFELNTEKIPTNILSSQTEIKPEDTSKLANSNIINSEQYVNIDKTDVLKQITSKFKTDYENQLNEIKIKLTPEHLGELTIKVSLERGILSARALVENSNIKQLLESNISELKNSLKEQGVDFKSIDVSVGKDSEFEEQSQNFFRHEKRVKNLKTNIENPMDMTYYEDLESEVNSGNLLVGEGSMDITI